jgi:hypothetical protein
MHRSRIRHRSHHRNTSMPSASAHPVSHLPQFSYWAKCALGAMESKEQRVETILFLLQTAAEDRALIGYADVRAAQLMLELRVHLMVGGLD